MLQMILPLLLLFGIWLVVNIYRGIISNLPGNLFILENTSVPPPASWRFFCPHPVFGSMLFSSPKKYHFYSGFTRYDYHSVPLKLA